MNQKLMETKNKKLINASVGKLKSIARQRGLQGYSNLSKTELVQLIDGSLSKYRAIAKQHGFNE